MILAIEITEVLMTEMELGGGSMSTERTFITDEETRVARLCSRL